MVEKTIAKPSFGETVAITTMDLDDVGLKFNAQKVGPMNFYGLRNADYGGGFRMPAMSELVPLVYASLENRNEYDSAKNVVKTLKRHLLAGNTGILYTKNGMYVQDNPRIRNKRISMTEKTLEKKLGSHQEGEVVFSDDKSVRFTPYGFKRELQTPLELSRNPGVVALVGGQENAEKIARASEHYKEKTCFWTLSDVDSPQTRVATLYSDRDLGSDRLDVDGDNWYDGRDSYAFGVSEKDAEGIASRK